MHTRIVGLVTVLALAAVPASAQVIGLPVFNSGVASGIGIAGDIGFSNNNAGSGNAYGATGSVGFGPLGFTATIANRDPKVGESFVSVGGTANLKVFGGPLIPFSVTLQGGAAYAEPVTGTKVLHLPVGVGFALNIPNPALAIKPWVAPRVDITSVSFDTPGVDGDTQTDFGFSAGVDFTMLSGLGLRAAYDYISVDGGSPSIFSIGAKYGFKVPGL